MTQNEYEEFASSVVGESPQKVDYIEIDYAGVGTDFLAPTPFDSLDYGLNLRMVSGKVFGFTWGTEFVHHGLSILSRSIESEISECRKIDVTASAKWSALCGQEIVGAEVDWSWVEEVGYLPKKTYYPQSLILTFARHSVVVISALEIREHTHHGMTDHITVFFNTLVADKYGAIRA